MKEQISGTQVAVLMFWQVTATGILTLPSSVAYFASVPDEWVVFTLMFGITTVMALLATFFARTFNDLSLIASIVVTFGEWIGRPLQWFLVSFYYLCACTVVREVSLFVETNFLRHTPIYVEMAVLIVPTVYLVASGLETLGRLAFVLTPVALLVTLVLYGLAMKNAEFHHLRPLLAEGWIPIGRASVYPAAFVAEFGLAMELLNSVKTPGRVGIWLFWSGLCVSLTGVLTALVTALVAGPVSAFMTYPLFSVVRSISIGEFVQRLDAWYVIVVIVVVMVKLSTFYYCMSKGVARVFSLGTYRSAVWPASVAVWAGGYFFFQDSTALTSFIRFTFPALAFTCWVILPMITCIVYRFRTAVGGASRPKNRVRLKA